MYNMMAKNLCVGDHKVGSLFAALHSSNIQDISGLIRGLQACTIGVQMNSLVMSLCISNQLGLACLLPSPTVLLTIFIPHPEMKLEDTKACRGM